jgi:hypothetical protein
MPGQLSGGLKITVTDFLYAAPVFQQTGTELGQLTEDICESLAGLGAFYGNDAAGAAFASSYLPAQDAIMTRLGTAAGAVSGVGDGLRQMAANYGITEYTNAFMAEELAQSEAGEVGSILSQKVHRPNLAPLPMPGGASSPGSTGSPRPDPRPGPSPTAPAPSPSASRSRPVTVRRPDPTPTPDPEPGPPPTTPEKVGPNEWQQLIPWPSANPGDLLEAGDQWTRLGKGILDIAAPADSQAASIAANNSGKAVDAFESYWQSYGGRRGQLAQLADACQSVARACYRYADAVNSARRQIEEAVVEFIAVVVVSTVAAFFTFGATEEAADSIGAFLLATARAALGTLSTDVPEIAEDLITAVSKVAALALASVTTSDASELASDLVKTAFGESLPPVAQQLLELGKGTEEGIVAGPLSDLGGQQAENFANKLEEIGNDIASGKIKVADPAIAGQFLALSDLIAAGGKAGSDMGANAVAQLLVNHEFSMQDLTSDYISSNLAEAIQESMGKGD